MLLFISEIPLTLMKVLQNCIDLTEQNLAIALAPAIDISWKDCSCVALFLSVASVF